MRIRNACQTSGRLVAMTLAVMSLTLAGMARAAVIIHTEVVDILEAGVFTFLVPSIANQPITSPTASFSNTAWRSGTYTVPAHVLANPYLKAVKVELVAAYEYDAQVVFPESGAVQLDIYGTVQLGSNGGGGLVFDTAGGIPYDDTATVDFTGNFGVVVVPTMTGFLTGVPGVFEIGTPEFDWLVNSSFAWRADFSLDVLATQITSFNDDDPLLYGVVDYNYDGQSPTSTFIITYYIPEPSSAALLSLALLGMLRRRSRKNG